MNVDDNATFQDLLDMVDTMKDEESGRYYLYKDGNEYTSITGGWSCIVGFNSYYHNQSTCEGTWLKKQSDHFEFYTNQTGSYYPYYYTLNKIDLSEYSYVGIEFDSTGGSMRLLGVSSLSPNSGYPYLKSSWTYDGITAAGYDTKTTITIPILQATTSNLTFQFSGNYNIYKIWLQK